MNQHDTTGWCDRGDHTWCSGTLRAATGHHWWCACTCHPEPPMSPSGWPKDTEAALVTWKRARAKLMKKEKR